jgi:RNA polymerase sigma-70 factor (ECF subfamily)
MRNVEGDEDLAEAVLACYARLRRFAAVIADSDIEPDDLVQEAFARALKVLSKPAQPWTVESVDGYMRRTIVNLVANERRRRGRARSAQARMAPPRAGEAPVYPTDAADLLASARPLDRALVYLVDVEGWRTARAGELLGLSGIAARTRVSRARKALKAALTADAVGRHGATTPSPSGGRVVADPTTTEGHP